MAAMEPTSESALVEGLPLFEYTHTVQGGNFRLLRVLPGSKKDPMRCELFTTDISLVAGTYIAGSYTWGSAVLTSSPSATIILNGMAFVIRANLHEFLHVLRSQDEVVLLWIDAICIDQSNLTERTHQVSLMTEIYGQAASVAIWLGPSSTTLEYAMDVIERLGADDSIHLDARQGIAVFNDDGSEHEKTIDVAQFFNLPWWFRVWTVQEYVLAKRRLFYCGTRQIEGKIVDNYARNVRFHYSRCCSRIMIGWRINYLPVTMEDSVHNIETLKVYDDSTSFLQTLSRFEFRLATDPRDRVYGFLGIARLHGHQLIDAIYEYSPQEVCVALVRRWVELYGNLDFLEHKADYPAFARQSFVPDWTGRRPWNHNRKDCDHRLRNLSVYNASAGQPTDFSISPDGSAYCTGIVVDTIKSTTTTMHDKFWDLFVEARSLSGFDNHPEDIYKPTGQSVYDAFALTMTAGLQYARHEDHDGDLKVRDSVNEHLRNWMGWLEGVDAECVAIGTPEQLINIYSVHMIFRSIVYGRSFVITEKGYFGFAPNSCKEGDVVALLFGSKSPCILRPDDEGQAELQYSSKNTLRCSLLGTAYIHGIMHGEYLKGTSDGEGSVPTTSFQIL